MDIYFGSPEFEGSEMYSKRQSCVCVYVCEHTHVSTEFQIVLSSGVQMAPAVQIEYEKFGDSIQLVAPDISAH
jgi:hypothetical protein